MQMEPAIAPGSFEIFLNLGIENRRNVRFSFDLAAWTLRVFDDEERSIICSLGAAEVRVFWLLLSKPGEVFGKSELIASAWQGRVVTIGSLTQAIFNIRSFLGVDGHSIIVTSPKAGYFFNPDFIACEAAPVVQIAPVSDVAEASTPAEAVPAEAYVPAANRKKRRRLMRCEWLIGIAGVLVVLLLVGLLKPEIELLVGDPLRIEEHQVGNLEVNFVTSGTRMTGSDLLSRSPKLAEDLQGRVWVRVYERRYRVVCYSDSGARAYAAPISVPLSDVIDICMKNAGSSI